MDGRYAKLRAWLGDLQISAQIGCPQYKNRSELKYDIRGLLDERERLMGAIHSAVSFTYIDTEKARLQSRVDLKRAAGWPLTDGELERLKELNGN